MLISRTQSSPISGTLRPTRGASKSTSTFSVMSAPHEWRNAESRWRCIDEWSVNLYELELTK